MLIGWSGGFEWEGAFVGISKFSFGVEWHKDGCPFCWDRDV